MKDGSGHVFIHCPRCAAELGERREGGRARPVCPVCGFVQYLNPAPGAGVVLLRDRAVCLVKRRFPPRRGLWSLPTGFVEWEEDVRDTAVRETLEETGLLVRLTDVYAVESGLLAPDRPVLVVLFKAEEIGGELAAGDDAEEAGFFDLEDLPGPVAFAAHRRVLHKLAADLGVPRGKDLR